MNDAKGHGGNDAVELAGTVESGDHSPISPQTDDSRGMKAAPAQRALSNLPAIPAQRATRLERALGAVRIAMPVLQRLLPLLDGNIAGAAVNLLSQHPQPAQAYPPVDLEPIEAGLDELRTQNRELRNRVVEHGFSLMRIEGQLEIVREAAERNSLQQQELLDSVRKTGKRANLFAFIALSLLGVSVLLNAILLLQLRHVLP